MRIFKILLILAMMMPVATYAQQRSNKASKASTAKVDKYPDFDLKEAAGYWQKWRDKQVFTQEDFARVMEMCHVGFDYLICELDTINLTISDPVARKTALEKLVDDGKTSDMNLFCRSFSTRAQTTAFDGGLSDENVEANRVLQKKKRAYRKIVDQIEHLEAPAPKTPAEPARVMPSAPTDTIAPVPGLPSAPTDTIASAAVEVAVEQTASEVTGL